MKAIDKAGASYKRARSDEQKAARREVILEAAAEHLAEVGVEHFSMGVLAKGAGIARATLYLYFETREALLLTLYGRHLERWSEQMQQQLPGPVEDAVFLDTFWTVSRADPQLLQLGAQLGTVIEHNVSMAQLRDYKVELFAVLQQVQRHFGQVLQLSPQAAAEVVGALAVLSTGLNQQCAGPQVDLEGLPEGVVNMVKAYQNPKALFMVFAQLVLDGVRARSTPS